MISTDDDPGALCLGVSGLVSLVLPKNKPWWHLDGPLAMIMSLESKTGLSLSTSLRQRQLFPALQLQALVPGCAWALCISFTASLSPWPPCVAVLSTMLTGGSCQFILLFL